ncbi:OmpA family protein [Chitinophaga tropicalis]|uniref:OmpA family protein n=1 Tax=Chitinophaga tropicalis TaxID=2683588 RepID=A0A7K1U7V2_9BACT|nr:OmpA family protein [Chitinophaga tropicalis]MVT10376.1 OmpA family protein [Chitinophaga tropicalis]
MRTILITGATCLLLTCTAQAQFLDRIKNKVQNKVNDAIDKTIDNAGKKKDGSTGSGSPTETTKEDPSSSEGTSASGGGGGVNADIKSYSKFDFIPGAKIIVQEDFSQDAIGDFPAQWNTRTGAEVVTVSNQPGKWLSLKQDGIFFPEYITSNFPENFTLQMDVMANNNVSNIGSFTIGLLQTKDAEEKFEMRPADYSTTSPSFKLTLNPLSSGYGSLYYSTNLIGAQSHSNVPEFNIPRKNFVTVSIWRQKQRVRVYLDSTKTLDLPRALDATAVLNSLVLSAYAPDFDGKGGAFYVSNIRLAVGAPDTRNKLITEGKFVTHGILFDVNSDKILAASYGSLQDIANVLKENASVRIKIIGHTDADGDEKLNLDLSKRRAAAVKEALSKDFGIDASRMETDGKGKTQPIDNNTTPAGKANNRRVEFVKL